MDTQEKYVARILFKNKIYESDGQAFEDLFNRVFQNGNANFKKVKAQGSYGDRKNDGFDSHTGTYYQVYAPEDLPSKEKDGAEKLETDFNGLKSHWESKGMTIKKFYYVINDKYKGVYPTIYTSVGQLNQKNEIIEIDVIRAHHLEDKFISQSDIHIMDIVGSIPNPYQMNDVDYEILTEVVNYILNYDVPDNEEEIPSNPNFDEKIEFNNLSEHVAKFLQFGRQQTFVINDFFKLNSSFAKEELREKFHGLYQEGIKLFGSTDTGNDQTFWHIRNKSTPIRKKGYYDAVYVLMAHYFEYCDIFKPVA
jgi:hypothetical protein